MNSDYQLASKEDYEAFIKNYDKQLNVDYPGVFPILSHNDFSDGKVWPESVVAFQRIDEQGSEPTEYYIRLLLK